jgi:glutathione S-transferase
MFQGRSDVLALYNFPQSTCSQKVRLVLWEKELPFEDRPVDHKSREHLSEWYLKLNPNGVVPTLLHDDAVIIDSSVIMEYLDEAFPKFPMVPRDAVGRAHLRKWLRYLEEAPTAAIRVPSFNQYLVRRYANMSEADYSRMADSHPIRKHFYKRLGKKSFSSQETEGSLDRLQQTVDRVDAALAAHGKPWIMGDALTIADACLMPTIDRMADLGLARAWDKRPKLAAWYERYASRPAFAKTYYPGTRLSEIFGGGA